QAARPHSRAGLRRRGRSECCARPSKKRERIGGHVLPAGDFTGLHPRMTGGDPTTDSIPGIPPAEQAVLAEPPVREAAPRPVPRAGRLATVVGVFEDRRDARLAVDELRQRGFEERQIGIIARDEAPAVEEQAPETAEHDHAAEHAKAGAVTGASLGGLW